ncbi:phosphoribosylglycinamide formyltransferase [Deinococcus maricopensis]|uniref:Phosphoribosylglycinamide formyltransferase n=1 Tax=Deinococcus maricopensis (strain DSM 21211 / LMG 22137 / NRRL B-23946 / LB-34) TaxID=709986 RepID=E8U9F2_DEIML|nr:phosphoribosylglycinamide formyltransferase [Deinococcus maricopensis]ADV67691.1 phosphoribosylglycinamide formyltransferase [Deinococcus maricopensis DSM 21211]
MTLAVLASGRGSNLAALLDAFPGDVRLVISDKPDAAALDRAREAGITAAHVPFPKGGRATFEAQVQALLDTHGVTLVLLAGFMRLLSADFTGRWRGRILNIHPSLLPAFPGLHAQQQALDAGAAWSGCTVHFVDAGMDTGDIILQKRVPVLRSDTADTLAARILTAEHEAYPQAVRLVRAGLAFPRPTPDDLRAEFGDQAPPHASVRQVRAARLLQQWGRPEAVPAVLAGAPHPVAALALATDDLRLAWTTDAPLNERHATWADRAPLRARAQALHLAEEFDAAVHVTAHEWERTTL